MGVNWRACAFTTSGVIGHRTGFSLSDVWPTFQTWGRSKTAVAIVDDRYFGQTHTQTDIHSSDFISVQCHALRRTDNKADHFRRLCAVLLTKAATSCIVGYLSSSVIVAVYVSDDNTRIRVQIQQPLAVILLMRGLLRLVATSVE